MPIRRYFLIFYGLCYFIRISTKLQKLSWKEIVNQPAQEGRLVERPCWGEGMEFTVQLKQGRLVES